MRRRALLCSVGVGVLSGCPGFGDSTETPRATETETTEADQETQTDRGTVIDTDESRAKQVPASALPEGVPAVPDGFDDVINVVDAGADPTGEEPIDQMLGDHLGGGTLLVFPQGRYKISKLRLSDLENTGMVAASGTEPVLVPGEPASVQGPRWIWLSEVNGFLFDGLDFDFRDPDSSGRLMITGLGDFAVRNIRVRGRYITPSAFRFDVRHPDQSALIENVTALGTNQPAAKTTGIYIGRLHAGEIFIRNCRLENFPDNGVYASPPGGHGGDFDGKNGVVHVEGGMYKNNNIANVRLGSTGSTARNVSVVVDTVPPHPPNSLNVRGIRLRGKSDQIVENCSVRFSSNAGRGFGGIVFHRDNGSATIRNTDIQMDRDGVPAIAAAQPSEAVHENQSKPAGATFAGVRITGTAGQKTAVSIAHRDQTRFRDCSISQSGANRDGIVFRHSQNCLMSNTAISVTGTPIKAYESDVTRHSGDD